MPEIPERLERARRELLDLSTRNRLLSAPVNSASARVIQVQDELAAELFRLLVRERKALRFLPGRKAAPSALTSMPPPSVGEGAPDDALDAGLPPPDETEDEKTGVAKRHVDSRLQTALTPEGLQRRLLELYRDARTTLEETGVNVLYLALGQLKWYEAGQPDTPRFAPLVLVPVELQRQSAATRFELTAGEEDVEENLSLRARLHADFGIELPTFPEPDDLELNPYFAAVAGVIRDQPGWEVLPNAIMLGLFSFAKLLMYRDLDPENWPADRPLLGHPLVAALLGDGFACPAPPIPEEEHLDDLISAERLDHVVDADGSQTRAIETVRRGGSLVVQGPPGTGKSQSITNLIATAVLEGKRVLFIAEKLAALEVVKRRLEREGLGDLCLELHSNKASKRAVLEAIRKTWQLGKPRADVPERLVRELEARRSKLNDHARNLHTPHGATGLTPFRVIGELVKLGPADPPAAVPGQSDGALAASARLGSELPGAETWDAAARLQREELVADLAERIQQLGLPAQHPWRGVQRETVLPMDLPPLLTMMSGASTALSAARSAGAALATALGVPAPVHLSEARRLTLLAEHAASAPTVDRPALCAGVWNAGLDQLSQLVSAGEDLARATAEAGASVTASAWEQDFEPVRASVAAHGRSWLRFLQGEYRRALATLRGVLQGELPRGFEARLALLDALVRGQRARRAVRAGGDLGGAAFGEHWRAERSDWTHLRQILDWVGRQHTAGLGEDFRRLFATVAEVTGLGALGKRLDAEIQSVRTAVQQVFGELALDLGSAFGTDAIERISFTDLEMRIEQWRQTPEALSRWSNFHQQMRQGRELGLGPLVDGLYEGTIPADAAVPAFQRACYRRILREMTHLNPGLARFDGELHARVVREFQRLDRDRLRLAKYRVLAAHHERMPSINAGVGAVGIVKSELERKRGHRPVRKLLADAASVVQAVKPVFMMSPLSVAEFLAPGAVEFDLLIVDEASQVQPVDALGAIARCRQIVVVGDSRQLPPTRFFARITGEADGEGEEGEGSAQAQDIESILGLCCARGLPQAMLRWHYRSRHHSLIAVSNHAFYEDQLYIVPSPDATTAELGLQFRPVPDGVFDSGGSGANRIEARAICRALMEHARTHPELTLGVAAFSVRQQQAILDELELRRRENPETEGFFKGHPHEPFFVKNLENVQGDERDVILISIGYGRDLNGFLAMRFGPLANEGGERRLNVLISRARKRCVVFSSITADDIDLTRAPGRGVRALKTFLQFAQTGRLPGAASAEPAAASPFEEAVRAVLELQGHQIQPQVGVAGFFVDLAVRDPEDSDRYLLGVEVDGEAYYSTRSARDRDRLRQAVLEDHGWTIHRVWSPDWFQRPAEQRDLVLKAIERARATGQTNRARKRASSQSAATDIPREEPAEPEPRAAAFEAEPYRPAAFCPPRGREPHELSPKEMADVILRIVQAEGPVHEDEIVARVKEIWGLQRAGPRLQDAVAKGVRALLVAQRCTREEDCLAVPDAPVRVRSRADAPSPGLRKPERLPPGEIRAAILALLDVGHGAHREELPTAIARRLGFTTTTAALREMVERQVQKLEGRGEIGEANGFVRRS